MNNQQKSKSIAKRTAAFFTAVLMVLTLVPFSMFSASAASLTIPASAKYYGGHMYYVFKNNVTWKKAKKLCESKGGHLATITSKGENEFVKELVEDKNIGSCWLGATDEAKEGTWKWVTGEKFSYKCWDDGEPNNDFGGENFLGIYIEGKWNDFLNDSQSMKGYVCEWEVGKASGIKQVSASSSSITLSWKDNDRISSFIIYYYDTSAKKYIKYKTVTKTSITISGLSSATTYKIAISSVFKNNGKTQVAPKTTFNAVTRPGTTKNLKIEDKISLTWSKVKGADGYVVYLYNSDRKKWETFDVVTKNSCKIGKKFGSASQQYKVRAFKKSTDGTKFYGGYSNTVKR
ncbi:MAG: lectin-like protein [Acutalibacteraceae bacterium]